MTKPLGLQHADKLAMMHMHKTAAEICHVYKSHAELLSLLKELVDIEGAQPGSAAWADKAIAAIADATKGEV